MLLLTCIVHALTSSGPEVKKYCSCSALYPWTMILSRALQRGKTECYRGLRVIDNMVLRRIFGSERDEVKEEWRKLHNEELNP